MQADSQFKRLPSKDQDTVEIVINGEKVLAQANDTVANAILLSGSKAFRHTPISGSLRAPYCLMGVCFECLVQVNGTSNVQGCMTLVEPGMQITTQSGRPELIADQQEELLP